MRILFVLLLFQSISPSIFSVAAVSGDEKIALNTTHSSIVFPVFLKEQEEREHGETLVRSFDLAPLIDFSNQSLNCTASQSLLYKGYNNHYKFGSAPPLFKFNCSFLI